MNALSPRMRGSLLNPKEMQEARFSRLPRSENYRTYYGRSLNLQRIEVAIRHANIGHMRDLTDMSRETLSIDGHASSVLGKRLNRVMALPWRVEAATGVGVDLERARDYAKAVEGMLKGIRSFKQRLKDLSWSVFDGRAVLEIEWRYVGGEWPWQVRDLHWVHPRRLSFGQDRDLRIVDSFHDTSDFRDIGYRLEEVPYKFIRETPRLFGDYPEREGLSPRIQYWSFFGRYGVRERMILLELFGKPWRIVEQTGDILNDDAFDDAFDAMNALGAATTAVLPKGYEGKVAQPQRGAGDIHREAIEHAQLIISKLVLGATSTTDAQPAGLGSNQSDVHKSEEDLVIEADGAFHAEAIEDDLVDAFVAVNRGPAEVVNAPRFKIEPEPVSDPKAELENIEKAAGIGMPVSLEDARERVGFRQPREGEAVLVQVHPEAPLGGVAEAPRIAIVYPPGKAPPPGETRPEPGSAINLPAAPTPTPSAAPPPAPGGAPPSPQDPPEQLSDELSPEDQLSLDEARALATKMTELGLERCEHNRSNRCRICGIERKRDVELGEDGSPRWSRAWRAIGDLKGAEERRAPEDPPEDRGTIAARMTAAGAHACRHGRTRKCVDCGVIRQRSGRGPWRALGPDGRAVVEG